MSETTATLDSSPDDNSLWAGDISDDPAPAQAPAPEDDAAEATDDEAAVHDAKAATPAPVVPAPVADTGPGDLNKALKESRTETAAIKAQLNQLLARDQQQQQAQLQARQAEVLQQDLANLHPDDIPAYLQAKQTEHAQALQQQAYQQQVTQALTLSESYAKAANPDYDTHVDKLLTVPGLGQHVANWASQQADPAGALYALTKGFHTDADLEAARAEGARDALAGKFAGQAPPLKPPAPAAARLGALPVAARPTTEQTAVQTARKALSKPTGTDSWDRDMDALFKRAGA